MSDLIVIRGAGDIATGTICMLRRCGFTVIALETERPTAIRRFVSLSEAVYEGSASVENVTARLTDIDGVERVAGRGEVPVLVDPAMNSLDRLRPRAVIDAVLAKRNTGLSIPLAPFTVALGPGFAAGTDCHAVIETNRGHNLGRVIYEGCAQPDTGTPGEVGGYGKERVIHAPVGGKLEILCDIGSLVEKGEPIAVIGGTHVPATLTGLVRGMLRGGYVMYKGMKMADIDPRTEEYRNCFTISDKARCIASGVLCALMEKGLRP